MGGLDEAVFYVHHAGDAWRETDGACEWLLDVCKVPAHAAKMARARARLGQPWPATTCHCIEINETRAVAKSLMMLDLNEQIKCD